MARHLFSPLADAFDGPSSRVLRPVGVAVLALAAAVAVSVWAVSGDDPVPSGTRPAAQPAAPLRPQVTFRSVEGFGTPAGTATPSSARPDRPHHPAPQPSTYHPPARTTKPPPPPGPTARYVLTSTWDDGFVPNLIVRNPTGEPVRWEIRLSYPSQFQVRVVNSWNATVTSGIGTLVFTGGPLAPGAEVTMGFQAAKARPAQADPTSCSVNSAPC